MDSTVLDEPAVAEVSAIEANGGDYPDGAPPQRQFFEYAGPLFSAVISPTSSVVEVNGSRPLRAVARVMPSEAEVQGNPRARSAILRVAERTEAPIPAPAPESTGKQKKGGRR